MREERIPGRPGVVIKRDEYNVPHIYGQTDDDVVFGDGYVLAEDRSLLIDQARFNGLIAAIDAPNLSAIGLIVGLASFKPSAQTNATGRTPGTASTSPPRRRSPATTSTRSTR